MKIKEILKENKIRNEKLHAYYNPLTGEGSPIERFQFKLDEDTIIYLPVSMKEEKIIKYLLEYESVKKFLIEFNKENEFKSLCSHISKIRLKHDFEFWAFTCFWVQDKDSKEVIPLKLRRGQRKVLVECEILRLSNQPIRIIICKARQWGGSTFTQAYMAWIQQEHKANWHSAICADVEDQAKNIRHMYTRFSEYYPEELGEVKLLSFEGSSKNKIEKHRKHIIGIGSMQQPDNLRSFDFAMLHISELGLFKETKGKSPEDLAQTLRSTVPNNKPYTFICLESTAKGVGNFFHKEWQIAIERKSRYVPIFISWFEIEIYQKEIVDYDKFIQTMTEYDWVLWELGATLEGINWYRSYKNDENYDDWRMQSEFPSTWEEAFQSTGKRYFPPKYVVSARKTCKDPIYTGDIFAESMTGKEALDNIRFEQTLEGELYIWALPSKENISNRYITIVDIGGKTTEADWSVITTIDRYWLMDAGKPEIVSEWRGHLEQDLVAWKAAQIATWYNNSLLVVESNSLRKEENTEGDHYLTVLDEISNYYENLYTRTTPEKIKEGLPIMWGFHTNSQTKPLACSVLNASLRDGIYIERNKKACHEFDTFEIKENGTLGAKDGCNDDLVMTRAIGLYISQKLPLPKEIIRKQWKSRKIINEASF